MAKHRLSPPLVGGHVASDALSSLSFKGKKKHAGHAHAKPAAKRKKRRNPDEDEPGAAGEALCPHCEQTVADGTLSTVILSDDESEEWCEKCVEDLSKCDKCGELAKKLEDIITGVSETEEWCPSCASSDTDTCESCEKLASDRVTDDVGGDTWCPDCVEDGAFTCFRCEDLEKKDEAVRVRTSERGGRRAEYEEYCESCVRRRTFECCHCEETISSEVDQEEVDGNTWCDWCRENNASYCEGCEVYYYDDDHNHEEDTGGISEYHSGRRRGFQPIDSPWIQRQKKPPVYFGVELEVEAKEGYLRSDAIEKVRNSVSDEFIASIERDGSLDALRGFEIITQPAGLDVHRHEWRMVDLKNVVSHDSPRCGLHVHMTRNAITKLTLGRMAEFLNDDNNRVFLETLMRRTFNNYAKQVKGMKISSVQKPRHERYEVLNLTNEKTVEFRLPKGSTKPQAIIGTVEFCNALIRFCEVVSSRHLNVPAFKRFIVQDEMLQDTAFLRGYMVDRGLATDAEMRLPKIKPEVLPTRARKNPEQTTYVDAVMRAFDETGGW